MENLVFCIQNISSQSYLSNRTTITNGEIKIRIQITAFCSRVYIINNRGIKERNREIAQVIKQLVPHTTQYTANVSSFYYGTNICTTIPFLYTLSYFHNTLHIYIYT